MREHELLFEILNEEKIRNKLSMDLSEDRYSGSAFSMDISVPFITTEKYDTPVEFMNTLKKYFGDDSLYERLMRVVVVGAMKYRTSAPAPDHLSERVYNF